MKILQTYNRKRDYNLDLWNVLKSMNKKGYLLCGMSSKAYDPKKPFYEKIIY